MDFMKSVSIFFIVIIHTMPFYKLDPDISFTINTFARFAVPLFFIISGFFFSKNVTKKEGNYFRKYIKKIILCYMFGALFYAAVDYFFYRGYPFSLYSLFYAYTEVIVMLPGITIAWFEQSYHLWFLQALVISILILYVFMDNWKILLVLSYILHFTGLFGESYKGIFSMEIPICCAMFFGIFYCTLGHAFAVYEDKIRALKINGYVFLFVGLLFGVLQHYEHVILYKNYNCAEYASYFFFTFPFAAFLFLFAMKTDITSPLNDIGKNVLAVYLVHLFVIKQIDIVSGIYAIETQTYTYQYMYAPLAYILSYALAKILLAFKSKMVFKMK